MCTAITFHSDGFYFGRTLDYEHGFGEEVVLTPRGFPLPFRQLPAMRRHHAILGMAHVSQGYPLYYDAMNEAGLCMAGLNFVGFARYRGTGQDPVAPFELIPWVLGQCRTAAQARALLSHTALTETDFSGTLPAARLHWLIADRQEAITLEATEEGLQLYDNPVGVLTNNPPFPEQLRHLANFSHLSPLPPENRFPIPLCPVSRGTGAVGLPGDWSSPSRFVRAAFTKLHAESTPENPIGQFFRILGAVEQIEGCCRSEDGASVRTLYTSCCDTLRRAYYCTTCRSRRITGIAMDREDLDSSALLRFPLPQVEDVLLRN